MIEEVTKDITIKFSIGAECRWCAQIVDPEYPTIDIVTQGETRKEALKRLLLTLAIELDYSREQFEKKVEPKITEEELRQMMHDPRYWRHREPEFVKRVTDGFRMLVGG